MDAGTYTGTGERNPGRTTIADAGAAVPDLPISDPDEHEHEHEHVHEHVITLRQ